MINYRPNRVVVERAAKLFRRRMKGPWIDLGRRRSSMGWSRLARPSWSWNTKVGGDS